MIKVKDELVVRGGLPNIQTPDRVLQVVDYGDITVVQNDKVNQQ